MPKCGVIRNCRTCCTSLRYAGLVHLRKLVDGGLVIILPFISSAQIKGVAVIFLILFGISTAAHVGQAVWYGMWWLLPTGCLCGFGELIGWSGRFWSTGSISPHEANPYMMQITTTIISPAPLIAVNFIVLGRIIRRLGPCYSRLTPRAYTRIFLTCDMISLLIQAAGGGIAASTNPRKPNAAKTQTQHHARRNNLPAPFTLQFIRNFRASRPARPMISSAERGVLTGRIRLMLWALVVITWTFILSYLTLSYRATTL
ncbi:RTA1 like protein-domain-containing protein [Mycena amicta]|nr:RTA1 like protein-domain-containing protein [Mycena amicta]